MRVANCVQGSSVFAIYAAFFFDPGAGLRLRGDYEKSQSGARAEGGRLRRPASLYQNHRLTKGLKLKRVAIFEAPVSEAAGYLLGAHHADHDCSVARQALDHDLPALWHSHLQRLGRSAPPRAVAPHGREGIGMRRHGASTPYAALGACGSW